ncbi:uncharacterized protein LOC144649672 [Oculina patagonica]
MKALWTYRVGPVLFCLAIIFRISFTGLARQFPGANGFRQTNEESVSKIPSVYRLLKGLNAAKQVLTSGNAATFQQDDENAKNGLWRHPIFYNIFSNRKKSIHKMLHRILNTSAHLKQDSHLSTKFKSRDSSEKKGTFKISDEAVTGKGEYTISPDQTDVGIKMKLRINKQQPKQPQQPQQPPHEPQQPQQPQQPKRPQQPKPSTADCIPSQFEQDALSIHNRYRAVHNAPALTLNCEMSKKAAAHAQKLADLDTLVQSGYTERPEQGENLSLGCYENREETAEEAIKGWFDEVCQYTFGKQGPQPGTSHFSQLVWKNSTELGIGKAFNKQSNGATCTFIVALYKPQGNFVRSDNAYLKNIEKGSFDESYCKNIMKAGLEGGYGFKRFQNN